MDDERTPIEVREMMRTPGWVAVVSDVHGLIRADEERISTMEIDGRSPEDVGAEYIALRRHADGLRDALAQANKYNER